MMIFVIDWDAKDCSGFPVPFAGCVGYAVSYDPPTDNTGWWVWLDVGEDVPLGYPAEMLIPS